MVIYCETGTGKIIGGCAADSPDVVITSVPSGCMAVYFPDDVFPDLQSNMGAYQIDLNSMSPVARTYNAQDITDMKASKIQQITDQCNNTLKTFQSSALGSPHTYLSDISDMVLLAAEYSYLKGDDYDGQPVIWFTVEAGNVTHTKAQFIQAYLDGRNYVASMKYRRATLEYQINAATTIEQINSIAW